MSSKKSSQSSKTSQKPAASSSQPTQARTTSQKHRSFVSEPMRGKPVTDLAGVGPKLGGRLAENAGCTQASDVYGHYLARQGNRDDFTGWMKDNSGANHKQANDCHKCLNEWSNEFL